VRMAQVLDALRIVKYYDIRRAFADLGLDG
jgi:hypothetical protein